MWLLLSLQPLEGNAMSNDSDVSQRKYHRLTDLASLWKLEVRELLGLILEGGIGVAILEFRGVDHHLADASDDGGFPSWAVFVSSDVLKKIVSIGEAYVAGGSRFVESEAILVFFPERRLTPDDLIVLPEAFAELANLVAGEANGALLHGPEMSPASRSTLLKQIAALAVLLSKQQKGFIHGDRPNGSKIAAEIEKAIATWPAETWGELEQGFFSTSKINESIREGLELIGFKKPDGGK